MNKDIFSTKPGTSRRARMAALAAAAAIAASLLSGCTTPTDSVVVGAIPDDYRTSHPIVIGEKEHKIDLPVGAGEFGMTRIQKVALGGFLDRYDRHAAPVIYVTAPVGSRNSAAAAAAANDFSRFIRAQGVPRSRIVLSSYEASAIESSAPIRVSFTTVSAQTHKCGRWPDDLVSDTSDNKNYANFGCSAQNNLAAQIANPADLLGPRKQSEIDAERRSLVIDDYRNQATVGAIPSGQVEY